MKENQRQVSDEAIKFVFWAIGIGAGTVVSIMTIALSVFLTKETAAANQKAVDVRIKNLESAVSEIKQSNTDFQKWLRDNWSKRHPGEQ